MANLRLISAAVLAVFASVNANVALGSPTNLGSISGSVIINGSNLALGGAFTDIFNFTLTAASPSWKVGADATNQGLWFTAVSDSSFQGTSQAIDIFSAKIINATPVTVATLTALPYVTSPTVIDFGCCDLQYQVQDRNLLLSPTVVLGPGTYSMVVTGMADPGAQYNGHINAIPVPEPETYAMLLAGLGAIGFLRRRRQQIGD